MASDAKEESSITTERVVWFTIITVLLLNIFGGGSAYLVIKHVGKFLLIAYSFTMPRRLITNEADSYPDGSTEAQALKALAAAWVAGVPGFMLYRWLGKGSTGRLPLIISLPFVFLFFFVVSLEAHHGGARDEHLDFIIDLPSRMYNACVDDNRCPHRLLWEETKRAFMEWRLGDRAAQVLTDDPFGAAT